jgi:zinc/manganese transport system permease protein
MAFALVSLVGGILLALGASVPISPYVTTISFLIWAVCVLASRRRRRRSTLGAREVAA